MSEPTVTCELCGRHSEVVPDGRGFPPDIAKRKLRKDCKAADCPCEPVYRAGVVLGGPVTGQTLDSASLTTTNARPLIPEG